MADTYSIIGQAPVTELVGQSQTRQAVQINARATPSGSAFSFIVDGKANNPTNIGQVALGLASFFNRVDKLPGVVDAGMYQDIDGTGQFYNVVSATVESSSGNSTDGFTMRTPGGLTKDFDAKVKAVRANLDAIEAL